MPERATVSNRSEKSAEAVVACRKASEGLNEEEWISASLHPGAIIVGPSGARSCEVLRLVPFKTDPAHYNEITTN